MTNSDRVLSFVQKHPGYTQQEISSKLHIAPEQQVNTILRNLMKQGLLRRERSGGIFRYYAMSTTVYAKSLADRRENITKGTRGKPPGESREQQEAESWLMSRLSKKLGIKLEKRRLRLDGGSWLELDGLCESPLVLCEAWAHIGSPKSAQKNKVMADTLKLLFVNELFKTVGKRILIFGDNQAASHFQGKSWMAQCLKRNDITIEIIELPHELKTKVLAAQKRQYR